MSSVDNPHGLSDAALKLKKDQEFIDKYDSKTKKVNTLNFNVHANNILFDKNGMPKDPFNEFNNFLSDQIYSLDALGTAKMLGNEVDRQLTGPLLKDMTNLLGMFYLNDQMLCCLVKALLKHIGLQDKIINARQQHDEMIRELDKFGFEQTSENEFELAIANTKVGEGIHVMILVIDIIISIMSINIKEIVMPTFDLIRELTEAVTGFLCIALQEIIFTLRDAGVDYIIQKIDERIAKNSDSAFQCLPYVELLSILKKYVHDYGLTKKLQKWLQGLIGDAHRKIGKSFKGELSKFAKQLAFLRWIRAILRKIHEATFSWEFCVFLNGGFDEVDQETGNPYLDYLNNIIKNGNGGTGVEHRPNFLVGDNNSILINDDGRFKNLDDFDKEGQNSFKTPVDDEIRAFLIGFMNISPDQADSMLASGGLNSDGSDSGIANSCGEMLTTKDIDDIFKEIVSNSRMG